MGCAIYVWHNAWGQMLSVSRFDCGVQFMSKPEQPPIHRFHLPWLNVSFSPKCSFQTSIWSLSGHPTCSWASSCCRIPFSFTESTPTACSNYVQSEPGSWRTCPSRISWRPFFQWPRRPTKWAWWIHNKRPSCINSRRHLGRRSFCIDIATCYER